MPHPEHNVDPLTGPTPDGRPFFTQRAELPRRPGLVTRSADRQTQLSQARWSDTSERGACERSVAGIPARWVPLLLLLAGVFAGLRGIAALPRAARAVADLHRPGGRGRRDRPPPAHRQPTVRSSSATSSRGSGRRRLDPAALRRRLRRGRLDHPRRRPARRGGRAVRPAGRRRPGRRRLGRRVRGRRRPGAATPSSAPWPARSPAAWPPSDPARPWRRPGPTARSPPTQTADDFLAGGLTTSCPITLVDAGPRSDEIIRRAGRRRRPHPDRHRRSGRSPGSDDPSLQVFYRLGTTFPGWLTSASTRRTGIVTLTDLTRTLVDFGRPGRRRRPRPIDGSPLAVDPAALTVDGDRRPARGGRRALRHHPAAYLVLGVLGAVVVVAVGVVGAVRRAAAAGPVTLPPSVGRCPAPCCSPESVPWEHSDRPVLALSVAVVAAWVVLAAAALGLGRLIASRR